MVNQNALARIYRQATLHWKFIVGWAIASWLGLVIGEGLSFYVRLSFYPSGQVETPIFLMPLSSTIYMFFVESIVALFRGVCLGGPQWWLVHKYLVRSYRWFLATTLGIMVGYAFEALFAEYGFHTVSVAFSWGLANVLSGLFLGTGLGLLQWMVLRRRTRQAFLWIVAVMLNFSVWELHWSTDSPIVTIFIATAGGLITGIAFAGLTKAPLENQPS